MTEKEKEAILYLNHYIDTDLTYESQHYSYIRMLIRLVGKQQKEIEELKEITKTYDSYIGEIMPLNSKIIIADREYFINGTFVNKFISKDKIRHTLLKFQNQYGEDLEISPKFFIGKEVMQYVEDMLDEIAEALDIKLLEEEL